MRGKLLDVLRDNTTPVTRNQLDVAWLTDTAQRDRALDSLLPHGLSVARVYAVQNARRIHRINTVSIRDR